MVGAEYHYLGLLPQEKTALVVMRYVFLAASRIELTVKDRANRPDYAIPPVYVILKAVAVYAETL